MVPMTVLVLAGVALFAAGKAAPSPSAVTTPPAEREDLDDLRWMEGRWEGAAGTDSVIEESWGPVRGESRVGTFRMVGSEGLVRFYELIVLRAGADGVTMSIRHFGRELDAWEEKDAPMVFRMTEHEENRAVFERREGERVERLVYARKGGSLTIRLEKPGKDGKPSVSEFAFRRAGT